jgi:assimilatory nitrate reductase catalytic subunit
MSTDAAVRTTCPYCGVGCGIVAAPDGAGGARITGDPAHPANRGRLCSKGSALGETLALEGRLLAPEIGGRRVGWDQALATVAARFAETVERHGPDAVAFYVSGQLLTEDYYVANKLMKGFIGSANIDTNSRLCMASSVAGHRRAFGSDTVPGVYEDLEHADLVVLVGSNLAWCHPVLFQRLAAAKEKRPAIRVVVVDPRRTATCAIADLHLALDPGSDVALFAGLLAALDRADAGDTAYVAACTSGLPAALTAARAHVPNIAAAAAATGLAPAAVARFYDWFAATERVVTVYSQGVNQSSAGTDKVSAIINCHLFTGRIGRRGMGPFSATGQPNAMGGREVGALANQLAAHMGFAPAEIERVGRFWRAPRMATRPGLKAVELFRAVDSGAVKALWVMATNPAVSLPAAAEVRRALAACPLVVVSDCVRATDTARHAHVLLPALGWGEKEGTVTNSERVISRQRAFLPPPGEARPDWWIVSEVAKRMGFAQAFAYRGPADIFREHAALSAFENAGARDFDLGGLAKISDADYAALPPTRWPLPAAGKPTRRFFANGRFFTPDRRARFVATLPRPPAHAPDAAHPLVLNTGRVRDQWHTMTRTGAVPRLARHYAAPAIELHPHDAERHGLAEGALVAVESRWGRMLARARVTPAQRPGHAFVPMHWNDQFAGRGCVNAVVNPETDPESGQPESKHTPVRIAPWRPRWQALILTRARPAAPAAAWWVAAPMDGHWRTACADLGEPGAAWQEIAAGLPRGGEASEFADGGRADYRIACLDAGGRLAALAFLAAGGEPPAVDADWLGGHFAATAISAAERRLLLAGRPGAPAADLGPVVCACFAVREGEIAAALAAGAAGVAEVGAATRAGTSCGSCKPEIAALAAAAQRREAA